MSESEQSQLPAAQVTPALPLSPSPGADDESPTTQIASTVPAQDQPERAARWTGSAPVRTAGGGGSRRVVRTAGRNPEDTLDLPADERTALEYPVDGLSVWERWRSRRRWRRIAATPTPPTPPPAAPTRATRAPVPRRPPSGWSGPPPGHAPYPGYGPPPATRRPPHRYGPPPGYGPPHGYGPPPPPPRRRRRKWPWVMLFLTVATVACCGGVFRWAGSYADQYPASIATDADVPGLTRSTDAARRKAADELLGLIESEQIDEQSVRLLYIDQRQRATTVVATTRFVADPEADLADRFTRLTGRLKLAAAKPVDAGPLGGYLRCASGSLGGRTVAVCGWADHGSLAVGVFTGRSVNEAAELLRGIRAAVLKRG